MSNRQGRKQSNNTRQLKDGQLEYGQLKGTMELKTVVQTSVTEYSLLEWFLKDYDELEYGVLYFQMYEDNDFQCVFKFIKTAQNLNVALRLCYTNADAMFYLDNGIPMSKLVRATEISKGLYVAEFPNNLVLHRESFYMTDGILKLVFRFQANFNSERRDHAYGEIGVLSDVDILSSGIKKLYLLSNDTDFIFNVADMSLRAHKCILSARSKFFEEYFRKYKADNFPVPDTTPGIMHEVLIYMYSGELSNMNLKCMIKVFELAYLLKIPSLKDRCCSFFEETRSWNRLRGVSFWEYEIE